MIRSRISGIAVAAVSLFTLAAQAGAQEAVLRFKFREGEVQKTKTDSRTTMDMGAMKIDQQTTLYMTLKVKKVEGDVGTLESKCTRVTAKMNNPMSGEEMTFDSDKDDESSSMMFQGLAALVGNVMNIKMNERGKVIETKAAEEATGVSTDEMQKMMQMSSIEFPAEAVKVDSEWTRENAVEVPKMGNLTTKMKIKVTGIEGGVVKAKFEATLEVAAKKPADGTPPSEEGEEAMQAGIKDGKISGTLEFDTSRGLMVRKVTKITMTVSQMGMEIPVQVEQTEELLKAGTAEEMKEETKEESKK